MRKIIMLLALIIGMALAVPALASEKYVIKKGDTLSKIACNYKVSVKELAKVNKIKNPNKIVTGKTLVIPVKKKYKKVEIKSVPAPVAAPAPMKSETVNELPSPVIPTAPSAPPVKKQEEMAKPASAKLSKPSYALASEPELKQEKQAGASDEERFQLAWNMKTPDEAKPNTSEWLDLSANYRQYWGLSGGAHPSIKSYFLDAGVYPLGYKSDDARNYFGAGLRLHGWDGETASGSKFEGNRWLVNLRSKQFLDGMDWGAMLHFGRQENSSKNSAGTWQGKQAADLAGFGGNLSWYPRKNDGEAWFSEIDGWGSLLFPLNKEASATYKGRPQRYAYDADMIASVGARVYIWDAHRETNLPLRFYAEAEFLGELPNSSSIGASIGVSDKWDILFAQVGLRADLSSGFNYSFVGVGVDGAKAIDLGIKTYRQSEAGEFQKTALALKVDGTASIQ